jgi:hypothetical protein
MSPPTQTVSAFVWTTYSANISVYGSVYQVWVSPMQVYPLQCSIPYLHRLGHIRVYMLTNAWSGDDRKSKLRLSYGHRPWILYWYTVHKGMVVTIPTWLGVYAMGSASMIEGYYLGPKKALHPTTPCNWVGSRSPLLYEAYFLRYYDVCGLYSKFGRKPIGIGISRGQNVHPSEICTCQGLRQRKYRFGFGDGFADLTT